MGKNIKKKNKKELVSKARAKEIADTFRTLGIVSNQPYQGADDHSKNFQKVSIYESVGFLYKTSGNTTG